MPRNRSSKMFAEMKQVTDRHYKCLTQLYADPLREPSEEMRSIMEQLPQDIRTISDGISDFARTCIQDLLCTNKKICDLDKELKSVWSHSQKVNEQFSKASHPASLKYLLGFNPIPDLRKQLQKESGYDPKDKDWHFKVCNSPLIGTASRSMAQSGNGPQEELKLPYFMEPLVLKQERRDYYQKLLKLVHEPGLEFKQRILACLIFGLDEDLGEHFNKDLVNLYMAEFCLDKKKTREARGFRCKYRNPESKEIDDYLLIEKFPDFEARVLLLKKS